MPPRRRARPRPPTYSEFGTPILVDTHGRAYRWPLLTDPQHACDYVDGLVDAGVVSQRGSQGPHMPDGGGGTAALRLRDVLLWYRMPRKPITQRQREQLSDAQIEEARLRIPLIVDDERVDAIHLETSTLVRLHIGVVHRTRLGGASGWRHTDFLVCHTFEWTGRPVENMDMFVKPSDEDQ